jgi:hypothetical protein
MFSEEAMLPSNASFGIPGQTPDDVFFRIEDEIIKKLAVACKSARKIRMEEHRNARCRIGTGEANSEALPSQRWRSRML